MKKVFVILFIFSGGILLSGNIFNNTYAYPYDIDNSVLFYKDNYDELSNDIKLYLSNIDDFIISNSSYMYGDKLIDNYDFLVYFATDYIINNREYYSEFINNYDKCMYIDKGGINNYTYDYVDMNKIYEVTDFYFGIKDFIIINDDVCVKNNYLSLIDYTNDIFNFKIVDVDVNGNKDRINAIVYYDNGDKYIYSFDNINNILKLRNVGVV